MVKKDESFMVLEAPAHRDDDNDDGEEEASGRMSSKNATEEEEKRGKTQASGCNYTDLFLERANRFGRSRVLVNQHKAEIRFYEPRLSCAKPCGSRNLAATVL